MIEGLRKTLAPLLILALVFQTGCGTILYPERRGQKGTRIDPGVAVLDGIGLLFFIIPGVIAFAVDFGNGCIYYSSSGKGIFSSQRELKRIPFDRRRGAKDVERLIRENTGVSVKLNEPGIQVFELNSVDDLPGRFAAAGTFALLSPRGRTPTSGDWARGTGGFGGGSSTR